MVPAPSTTRRRAVLATTGAGLSGLAGCNFGYIGDTGSDRPPLWGESIRVGVLAPSNLPHGEAIANGAQLVAERINADGGIAGASIELERGDPKVSPQKAHDEHRRLCEEADCDLTVGLFFGPGVLETLDSIAAQKTVHLTTGALDGRAGRRVADEYDAYRYHFRPGLPQYRDLADALLAFIAENAEEFGWQRAALISERLGELEAYHERLDARLPDVLDVPISHRASGLTGWSPLYDDVERENCDVTIVGRVLGGPSPISRWALQERDFAFGGLNVFAMAPDYWEQTDGTAEYTFSIDGLTSESNNTGQTRGFVADYETRFETVPVYSAATTYDALKLYRQAVEGIVGAGDTELPSQDAIVEALEDLTFTDGLLYDELAFTGSDADWAHEPVYESMSASGVPVVQQWQADGEGGGKRVAVAPERSRTTAYRQPPWIGGDT